MIATGTEYRRRSEEIAAHYEAVDRALDQCAEGVAAEFDPLIRELDDAYEILTSNPPADPDAVPAWQAARARNRTKRSELDAARSQAFADCFAQVAGPREANRIAREQADQALQAEARPTLAYCTQGIIAAADLEPEAQRIVAELDYPDDPAVVVVRGLADLRRELSADRYWGSVWLLVEVSDGKILLGGEMISLGALAAEWGPELQLQWVETFHLVCYGPQRPSESEVSAFSDALSAVRVRNGSYELPISTEFLELPPRHPVPSNLEERCYAPGFFAAASGLPVARILGYIAHHYISNDYARRMNAVDGDDLYSDDSFAGPIDYEFSGWILRHNPTLPPWVAVGLSVLKAQRPDLVLHRVGQREFEEIKPDSIWGQINGQIKVANVAWLYRRLRLPYVRGFSYAPPQRIPVVRGVVPGIKLPFEVRLSVIRFDAGLLTYRYCVKTDWKKLSAIAWAVIIATIITIATRGKIRIPIPIPGATVTS